MCPYEESLQANKGCVAAAATIIGAKWTPQILYGLHAGVSRFCELQKEVAGINPRTLSARLDDLVCQGIVTKQKFNEVPPHVEYTLTEKGKDLLPILECMVAWGEKHPPEFCPEPEAIVELVQ